MVQVSILVPVYKCENFVYKCADSLFSQTFEDVEFIFYDDCSPDRSVQVIESCLKKYPNRRDQVRIIVNTQFRAYPFYKASEWMPHKKLLLNSIVF